MKIQKIEISKLKEADYNPRVDLKPGDVEYEKIKRSIKEFGFVEPIIVNFDMTIIGGHQRYKVLKELGYKEIECSVVNLDKTKEKALNIALNKISGDWDNDKLEELLRDLQEQEYDLDFTGFTFDEIDRILENENSTKDDQFDLSKTLKEIKEPITKLGDIWQLGKHRLMCGDCTIMENVLKLTNNNQMDLILTDPPYNVNYEGATEDSLTIKNDNLSDNEFENLLLNSFKNMFDSAKPGASVYVFHADTEGIKFRNAFKECGFKLAECLVWVKNTFVLGRQDYQWKHEPILYGWKEGAAHYFVDDRTQSTVLEFDKPSRNVEHPTMKPIDLITYLIKNSSKEHNLILDLFGGSGSTLIAAEQTDRVCYTMELDPVYCDVIIKRWESLTGKKAIKI
ncbi:MAG: DNA modification methylase [Clostridia bacterium]|nr:DNA modification methylase [Clostridia bacterium]